MKSDAFRRAAEAKDFSATDDLFSDDPGGLWSAVLRRQGGPYALLSLMPPDPSLN